MITKEELERHQRLYSEGCAEISDEEYDLLVEEYVDKYGETNRPYLRNKQSTAINDVVGTLPKVYGVQTPMRPGQKTYSEWIRLNHVGSGATICLQPKFDGCSIAFDCITKHYFTRGDYDNGESIDVTDLFKDRIDVDINNPNNPIALKFEAIMAHETFERLGLQTRYKRPRDAVAATITSRNVDLAQYITLVPLRAYTRDEDQFIPDALHNISRIISANNFNSIESFISDILADSAQVVLPENGLHYSVDGVVVSVLNFEFSERGFTVPDKEVAIKILNNIKETKLIDVKWQFGKTGRITPVAVVEPVVFDSVTVTNIGLSTFERVCNMFLKQNDTVRIVYNIVPYLLDSLHDGDNPIQILTHCPQCGAELDTRVLKQVHCTNPNCCGRLLGDIVRYAEKMKMYGVSKGILTKLFDNKLVTNLTSLYQLIPEEMNEIDGFGPTATANIISSIKISSIDVPLERWLGALPCRDVSIKTWKLLINANSSDIDDANDFVKTACRETEPDMFLRLLCYANGIGPATIRSINEGIRSHWNDIHTLIEYVTFKKSDKIQQISTKGRVAMTGTRDEQLTDELRRSGYDVDSFNNKCAALIVPTHDFVSNKVKKALELGIPIYDINEAYNYLVNKF